MSIPQDDFKLAENIKKEFGAILKKETDKEKMDELSRLLINMVLAFHLNLF